MNNRRNISDATPPRKVASYPRYPEAEAAVDYLSDKKFPVQYVSIVADDLQFVENIKGRLTWLKASTNGALSGALVGALIGFFFGLMSIMRPLLTSLEVATSGAIFGSLIGLVFGLVFYLSFGGKRDFESEVGFRAKYFDLMADGQYADEAISLLNKHSSTNEVRTTPSPEAELNQSKPRLSPQAASDS